MLELEYSGNDFAAMDVLARRVSPAGSLSSETGGDLARSPRWDQVLRQVGIGDEAVIACRDALGCWGWLKAYRDGTERPFAGRDLDLLAQVGPGMGAALRRSLARDRRSGSAPASAPGVIVLDSGMRPLSWTAGARAWIDVLPAAQVYAALGMLPAMVYPVATLARSRNDVSGSRALERAVDGRWVMIEAAPSRAEVTGRSPSHSGTRRQARRSTVSAAPTHSRGASVRSSPRSQAASTRMPPPSASRSPATRCRTTSSPSSPRSASTADANSSRGSGRRQAQRNVRLPKAGNPGTAGRRRGLPR